MAALNIVRMINNCSGVFMACDYLFLPACLTCYEEDATANRNCVGTITTSRRRRELVSIHTLTPLGLSTFLAQTIPSQPVFSSFAPGRHLAPSHLFLQESCASYHIFLAYGVFLYLMRCDIRNDWSSPRDVGVLLGSSGLGQASQ
jgi:hypothetical protein